MFNDRNKEENKDTVTSFQEFSAIRLKVASPGDIHRWSYGEVTRPETINYRTQRPEKDGLFSERIFGPQKDWECYCGKYKKIRYKGIVCDKCGVEVTRSSVRRERMGHIDLAAPVSHIWFLRGVPSKIGLVLDLSVQNLEKVIYFASFIITEVREELKNQTIEQIQEELKQKKRELDTEFNRQANQLRSTLTQEGASEEKQEKEVTELLKAKAVELASFEERASLAQEEVKQIKQMKIINENTYRDFSFKYGHLFEAEIGAEAVHKLLERLDLQAAEKVLAEEIDEAQGLKKEKLLRRAKLLRSFITNGLRPEWMVLTTVPVIPPDLRPMVALDGGRFATSDLNDLYRRVINRNNRLKQLIELKAPEVICRNEKRMLQEAVDALIDNSARHGKTVMAATGQKRQLKSLADMLKGKRGRFRQNLLGKRIDYSGRSVIVVGPTLKLHECGLPKTMALDLFKPFVISQLIKREYVYNVRSASRFIESGRTEVWDILEEIVKDSYVFLNRAPTLHRLGIQAFKPLLIEGKAIQIHPLVCQAFNADFDGDQMAVHVPLSQEAREEAATIMLSSKNLLKPATGEPIAIPLQDIVWGAYYLTSMSDEEQERKTGVKYFSDEDEAILAYSVRVIGLQEKIILRPSLLLRDRISEKIFDEHGRFETTLGRILFLRIFPPEIKFQNTPIDKKGLQEIVATCLERCGMDRTAQLLDNIKDQCAHYLTQSGWSFGMGDVPIIQQKYEIIKEAEISIDGVEEQFGMGLLTFVERKSRIIEIWTETRERIAKFSRQALDKKSSVYSIIESGARGNWTQLNQIIGMKGLVANPTGETIELAVKSSFKEGLEVLEYFISTHGARKGLVDTALRTSSAGYLTRRLVDVSQDVVVREHDCGDTEGSSVTQKESERINLNVVDRCIGRILLKDITDANGTVIVKKGELLHKDSIKQLKELNLESITIRSALACKSLRGLCQLCYGIDPGYNELVKLGTAVGIIAAQSLGEPGTQLTMRTFHTGGVAIGDITQGIPRVEELFEARIPKQKAILAEVSGKAIVSTKKRTLVDGKTGKENTYSGHSQCIVSIAFTDTEKDLYKFTARKKVSKKKIEEEEEGKLSKKKKEGVLDVKVAQDATVGEQELLFVATDGSEVRAKRAGVVSLSKFGVTVGVRVESVREYIIPPTAYLVIQDGQEVQAGDPLTEGNIELQALYQYKGQGATQRYIINEIQHIYTSQAQRLNDKHIEIIVKQMFSRMYVLDVGDTDLLPGEVVELSEFIEANNVAKAAKKREAQGDQLLMGITKSSLSTRSWLSAASFQETARVLINAAVTGKADNLEGLKENVIIGRLIPVGTGFVQKKKEE